MNAYTTYANEYLFWENTTAISVAVKKAGGTTTVNVSKALQGISSYSRVARRAFGELSATVGQEVFVIPDALLSGESIKPGDRITDADSAVYAVDQVTTNKADTQWVCLCTRGR